MRPILKKLESNNENKVLNIVDYLTFFQILAWIFLFDSAHLTIIVTNIYKKQCYSFSSISN